MELEKTLPELSVTIATRRVIIPELHRAQKRQRLKKPVAVLATSASVTEAITEALQRVPCIRYLVQFRKQKDSTVQALVDSGSEVNAMTSVYASKLGLVTRKTDVGAQKIDGLSLKTYRIVIAGFSLQDKPGRV